MKPGIFYRGNQSGDAPLRWVGVPVAVDCEAEPLAHARGILFWKRIVVNAHWCYLPRDEQLGVLAHEYAHVRYLHMEVRILAALIPIPAFWRWLARQQEFQADRDAAMEGYGAGLLSYLMRPHGKSQFHPAVELRREKLRALLIELAFEFEGFP